MEIEIDSKRNNPLLNRTEIYFTLKHKGEGTPNREIIRSELADKLNVKKESVIVNTVHSSFGNQQITGYAKIYSSLEKSKEIEPDYILVRNKLMEAKAKGKKSEARKPAGEPKKDSREEKPPKSKPAEELAKKPETPEKSQKAEKAEGPSKKEEKPAEKPKGKPGHESEQHAKDKKV